MRDFRELAVWQKAHDLALSIYKVTRSFPAQERYGLSDQLRRAAVSVPANIVEGTARGSDPDTARFLLFSRASAAELEYHLLLARDLGLVSVAVHSDLTNRTEEARRMLNGFLASLAANG